MQPPVCLGGEVSTCRSSAVYPVPKEDASRGKGRQTDGSEGGGGWLGQYGGVGRGIVSSKQAESAKLQKAQRKKRQENGIAQRGKGSTHACATRAINGCGRMR